MPHPAEHPHERPPAAVLLAGAVSLAGILVLLAAEGRWDPVEDLDVSVATTLHNAVHGHPAVVRALEVGAAALSPAVFRTAVGLTVAALWVRGWRRLAAWCVGVAAAGGLVGVGMKDAVARARPVLPDPVAAAPGYSFPSGHALNSALCCGILLVVATVAAPRAWRQVVAIGAVLVALTGFDRVALGVHFASDVLAGWCTAAAVVLGALGAVHLDRLRFRGRARPATPAR